jgi:hypothetical protein
VVSTLPSALSPSCMLARLASLKISKASMCMYAGCVHIGVSVNKGRKRELTRHESASLSR